MSGKTVGWTDAALCLVALLVGLVLLAHPPSSSEAQPSGDAEPDSLVFSLNIYGDTPSFAWSPDGQFLAFADANYQDYLWGYRPPAERAGVYVYRRAENDVEQVRDQVGYSPRWTDGGELSVCLEADHGRCQEHGTMSVAASVAAEDPASVRQCGDRDGVAAVTHAGTGLWIEVAGQRALVDPTPAYYFDEYEMAGGRPVEACLSPDLELVAYMTAGGEVRIHHVPDLAAVASSPSQLVVFAGGAVSLGLSDEALERHRAACLESGSSRCSDRRFDRERPAVSVEVAPFAMEVTEVTRAQYAACVEAGGCPAIDESTCRVYDGESWVTGHPLPAECTRPDVPRTCVTRDEARAYCAHIERRLPTEAEWQLAAGGTEGRVFAWGDSWSAYRAAYGRREPYQLAAVRSHPSGRTPEGLYHMSGNAYEWVADGCDYERWPAGAATCVDAAGRAVIRGGSFLSDGGGIRTSYRRFNDPGTRADDHGFRCAVEARAAPVTDVCGEIAARSELPLRGTSEAHRCMEDELGAWALIHESWDYDADRGGDRFDVVRVNRDGVGRIIADAIELEMNQDRDEHLTEVARFDLNADGALELYVSTTRNGVLTAEIYHYEDGAIRTIPPPSGNPTAAFVGHLDADGDGREDLLVRTESLELELSHRDAWWDGEPRLWGPVFLAHNVDGELVLDDAVAVAFQQTRCADRPLPTEGSPMNAEHTVASLEAIVCARLRGESSEAWVASVAGRCPHDVNELPRGQRGDWHTCLNLDVLRHVATDELALPLSLAE